MGTADDQGGSVTTWLNALKGGDPAAAEAFWRRYFARLVGLARSHLRARPGRARPLDDEEDVALSVLDSLCARAARGLYPNLHDREGLWRLLVTITANKVSDRFRHARRQRQGGGRVRSEADHASEGRDERPGWTLDRVVGDEPSPEFAAEMTEQLRRLLDALPGDDLRQIALWRLEGYSRKEIEGRLGRSPKTVYLKLELIRKTWEAKLA